MIIFIFDSRQSANEIFNHFAAELAELYVTAGVEVGELVVIQAKQVKQRNVQIANRMNDLGGFRANLVGGPHDRAFLHSAAGHETRQGIDVVPSA